MFDEQPDGDPHGECAVEIRRLQAERDEADRRAGAAEREMEGLRDDIRRLNAWRDEQKRAAGYSVNTSFDTVWADTLAAAKALKGEHIDSVGGDVLPPLAARVLIHLGREDKWVEHVVVGYFVWPPMGSGDLRVFVRVRAEDGYLNCRLLKDVRKLDGTPYLPARTAGVTRLDEPRPFAYAAKNPNGAMTLWWPGEVARIPMPNCELIPLYTHGVTGDGRG